MLAFVVPQKHKKAYKPLEQSQPSWSIRHNNKITNLIKEKLPKQVAIFEVGPRDGLQNEPHLASLGSKATTLKFS
ncbi:hypothetical protein ACP5PY_06185 [Photobacterium leiognathi subsp. mandapamensis]